MMDEVEVNNVDDDEDGIEISSVTQQPSIPRTEIRETKTGAPSLLESIKNYFYNPAKEKAKADNIVNLASTHGKDIDVARGYYHTLTSQTFGATELNEVKVAEGLKGAGKYGMLATSPLIPIMLWEAPLLFLGGTALAGAVGESVSYINHWRKGKLDEYGVMKGAGSAENTESGAAVADIVEFLASAGAGVMGGAAIAKTKIGSASVPGLWNMASKHLIDVGGVPKSVFIEGDKVKSIFQTGEYISPEEEALITASGLSGPQYRQAIKYGIDIEISTDKLVQLVDRPWWGKLKNLIKVSPTQVTVERVKGGKVTGTPRMGSEKTVGGAEAYEGGVRSTSDVKSDVLPLKSEETGATSAPKSAESKEVISTEDVTKTASTYDTPAVRLPDGSIIVGEKGQTTHVSMWDKVEKMVGDVEVKDRGWVDESGTYLTNEERAALMRTETDEALAAHRQAQEAEYQYWLDEKKRIDLAKLDPMDPYLSTDELIEAKAQLSEAMKSLGAAGKDFAKDSRVTLSPELRQERKIQAHENKKLMEEYERKFKAVKTRIREITGQVKVGEVMVSESTALKASLKRAQRASKEAMKEGRKEGAQIEREKYRGIIRTMKERAAMKREVDGLVRGLKRIGADKRMDPDYADEISLILSDFDLAVRSPSTLSKRQSIRDFVTSQREKGEIVLIPDSVLDKAFSTSINELTIQELRDLSDTVHTLSKLGKLKKKLVARKIAREFDEEKNKVVERIMSANTRDVNDVSAPYVSKRKTKIERAKGVFSTLLSSLVKVESLVDMADGWTKGPVYDNIFKPAVEAENEKFKVEHAVSVRLKSTLEKLEDVWPSFIGKTENIAGIPMTRENAVAVALNAGNEGNVRNLVDRNGNGFTRAQVDAIVNSLTPTEREFVSDVWELLDSFRGSLSKVYKTLTGKKLKLVDGHYYPIITDRELNDSRLIAELAKKDLFQDVTNRLHVGDRMTKERTGGVAGPLSLTLDPLFTHIRDVIHYTTHALPVRDMQKFIFNEEVRSALKTRIGDDGVAQFDSWIKDLANPKAPTNTWERVLNGMRANAAAQVMGWSLSVSLIQPLAYSQVVNRIGMRASLAGLADFYSHPFEAVDTVLELSPYMRERTQAVDRDIKDTLQVRDLGDMFKSHTMRDSLFSLMMMTDKLATFPAWWTTYTNSVSEGLSVAEAVDNADKFVRQTQSSGMAKDLPRVLRGNALEKLFTMFSTFFSSTYNEAWMSAKKYGDKYASFGELIKSWWWLFVFPGVASGIYYSLMTEGDVDAGIVAKKTIGYAAGTIPIVGGAVNSIMDNWEFRPTPIAAVPKEIRSMLVAQDGHAAIKHGINVAGYATGIPARQINLTYDFVESMLKGQPDPTALVYKKKKNKKKSGGFKY